MPKFQFVLLMHAHQPVGNFDDVIERAYQDAYLPFIDVLSRHPAIRIGLHIPGRCLNGSNAHIRNISKAEGGGAHGQVEIVGGGFYEPILAVIPPQRSPCADRSARRLRRKAFRPRPARSLARRTRLGAAASFSLAPAGVEYTLVRRQSFSRRGIRNRTDASAITSPKISGTVKVLPGLKALRYMIPFRAVRHDRFSP